ncbi:MAG: DUF4097 family beta strand repeat-containing protein [Gemmatimonadota bacterium]
MRRFALGMASLGLAALVMPVAGSGQEEHRVRGSEVAVYNLAGAVEVVPGSGSEVVVQVTRGGKDAGQLEVGVREVEGRQALVIRYPADQVIYPEVGRGSRTQIRVRSDGTFFGDRGSPDTREVRISGSGSGLEAWADLRIEVPRGSNFALFLATGETNLREVNGSVLIDTGSGAVHARASAGDLSIDTGSGAVTVRGFEGDLDVDTGSGSIEIHDVRGDHIRIDTGSGSVAGSQLVATSVGVDTGSGAIDLRGVSAPDMSLDTGSGSVEVELLGDVDRLEIDTGSGSVTIWVPATVGAEVEMDTGAGGIDLDLPLEVREARRDYVRGILGDGQGRIHVDTGSGRVRLIGR